MSQAERDRLVTLKKAKKRLITQREAALELGLTIRHVKRLLKALKKSSDKAVIHGLRRRPSPRRLATTTMRRPSRFSLNASRQIRTAAVQMAVRDSRSPLFGLTAESISALDGYLQSSDKQRRESYADLIRRSGQAYIESKGATTEADVKAQKKSAHSFGAHFVEVRVDPDLRTVRVGAFPWHCSNGASLTSARGGL